MEERSGTTTYLLGSISGASTQPTLLGIFSLVGRVGTQWKFFLFDVFVFKMGYSFHSPHNLLLGKKKKYFPP